MQKYFFLVVGICALIFQGCANPFSDFYSDQTGGMDVTKVSHVQLSSEEPKLYTGTNPDEDYVRMLESNYVSLGYSSFNGANVDTNGAVMHAKKIHASVVLLYSKYTNTVSGVMPFTTPTTQTSNTDIMGNVYGTGGYANFSGNVNTTTYGSQTTYIPYNIQRSDYFATYWVKIRDDAITCGLRLIDLTPEIRKELGSNKGMLISAVIKNSPAFYADVLRGDILIEINNKSIFNENDFLNTLREYSNQTVTLHLYRDGKDIEKKVKLSQANY